MSSLSPAESNPQVNPDRVMRRIGQKALDKLAGKTVVIVGFGSLGSETTILLAKSMVGRFVLIDSDTLEAHNIVRHAADLRYVGLPKVEIGAELIRYRNPDAQVLTYADSAQNVPDAFHDVDLVIVAGLGSEIAQQEVGIMLRKLGLPVLFGGLYEKGVAGEVLFVSPTEGPCYSCFSSILRDVTDTSTGKQVNYGLPMDEVKAEPGLGIHVTRVAVALADWALRFLIDDPEVLPPFKHNLVILSNEEYVVGTTRSGKDVVIPPSSSYWKTVEKIPECNVCGLSKDAHSTESISDLIE